MPLNKLKKNPPTKRTDTRPNSGRLTLRGDPAKLAKLRAVAREHGKQLGEFVIIAVEDYLENHFGYGEL